MSQKLPLPEDVLLFDMCPSCTADECVQYVDGLLIPCANLKSDSDFLKRYKEDHRCGQPD